MSASRRVIGASVQGMAASLPDVKRLATGLQRASGSVAPSQLPPITRRRLEQFGLLATDQQGREIMLGLTWRETEWYIGFVNAEVPREGGTTWQPAEWVASVNRYHRLTRKIEEAVRARKLKKSPG